MGIDFQRTYRKRQRMMNTNTLNSENSQQNFPHLTSSTTTRNNQGRFLKRWLLIPGIMMTLLGVTSSYSALQAIQNPNLATAVITENPDNIAPVIDNVEVSETRRTALEQQYQATLNQLQATQTEQGVLQIAHEEALYRLDKLKRENQQLKSLANEGSTLKVKIKQLEDSNSSLNGQFQESKQQVTMLQNRLKVVENEKNQLTKENQKLQPVSSELLGLKAELAQANRTIELLNARPSEMININGKQFSVTPELAAVLREKKPIHVSVLRPSSKELSSWVVFK